MSQDKPQAQITLQVVLEGAIFSARYRGMQLESETTAVKNEMMSARKDLVLRHTIIKCVVQTLQRREAFLRKYIESMRPIVTDAPIDVHGPVPELDLCEHGGKYGECDECGLVP